ncbi:MAG: hypothetical protein Q7U47_13465 [Paludibacter sp.]|nr:hypothetical protein [Paludibacter sp.]
MKEELTDKMHSEFTIDRETEIQHSVWIAYRRMNKTKCSIEEAIQDMGITMSDFRKYEQSYLDLFK